MPGSQVQFLDVLHRRHIVVKYRVHAGKGVGLRNLAFHGYERQRCVWVPATNIAADLIAHLQLLDLNECDQAARAEPESLRTMMVLQIAARLTRHARRRVLKMIER